MASVIWCHETINFFPSTNTLSRTCLFLFFLFFSYSPLWSTMSTGDQSQSNLTNDNTPPSDTSFTPTTAIVLPSSISVLIALSVMNKDGFLDDTITKPSPADTFYTKLEHQHKSTFEKSKWVYSLLVIPQKSLISCNKDLQCYYLDWYS